MSEQLNDITVINNRLKQLNQEYRDLSALKKKVLNQSKKEKIAETYSDYKFLVKKKVNEPIDFDKLISEGDLEIVKSFYGLPVATYDLGKGQVHYHIAKTEKEADQIRAIESLMTVADHVKDKSKNGEKYEPQTIIDLFEKASNGHQLEESTESEEVSE